MTWHAPFTALPGAVTHRTRHRAPGPRHRPKGLEKVRDRAEYDRTMTRTSLPPKN